MVIVASVLEVPAYQCSSLEQFSASTRRSLFQMSKTPFLKNIVGRRVAEGRQACKPALTQDALSGKLARLGIQLDRAAIAKIEKDHRHVLDYELKALAKALGVDVNWLLGDDKR